ncbi:mitochondrial glycoprotein [Whalleya microplaca]|nr:mitochondrial glycoprotein [Whalleya microplaca]
MMSLRAVARSAPRSLTRLSSIAVRQSRVARPSALLKSSWAPLRTSQFTSAFSTTPLRQAPAAEVDEELSVKLESEMEFEGAMKDGEKQPASVKDFLENSPFELTDKPGKESVSLTRKFGNEKITVTFSISDLSQYNDPYSDDEAFGDEDIEEPEEKRLNEEEAEEGNEEEAEDHDSAVPCHLTIVVEKDGKGALHIEAAAQDGQIMVESFYYYKDAKLAYDGAGDFVRREGIYPGPPFDSLDDDLQVLMERYLEERGVTQAMAVFVPDYLDLKEQREYQGWLKNVKEFVDA